MNYWGHIPELSKFLTAEWAAQVNHAVDPFLKSQLLGVVSLAEPFGVARPTKIWAHVETRSAEKEEYAVHIAHDHCRQHHETLKLHHCQNKMG